MWDYSRTVARVSGMAGCLIVLGGCGARTLRIEPAEAVVEKGQRIRFEVMSVARNGEPQPLREQAIWEIEDPSIGVISSHGSLTALRCGETVVMAVVHGDTARTTVTMCGPSFDLGTSIAELIRTEGLSVASVSRSIDRLQQAKSLHEDSFIAGFEDSAEHADLPGVVAIARDLIAAAGAADPFEEGMRAGEHVRVGDIEIPQLQLSICPRWKMWDRPGRWAYQAGVAKGYGEGGALVADALLRACGS